MVLHDGRCDTSEGEDGFVPDPCTPVIRCHTDLLRTSCTWLRRLIGRRWMKNSVSLPVGRWISAKRQSLQCHTVTLLWPVTSPAWSLTYAYLAFDACRAVCRCAIC
jgi:hypothetical protein